MRALLFFVVFLLLPAVVFANIGVGVGSGKITVSDKLRPGGIYELPSLPVLNTGDEPGEYGVSVEYHENQPQLRPSQEWFSFEPSSFHLDPGKLQTVKITLTVPLKTVPGDYFAYLEAHPIKKDVAGQTSIGIAAAAKLYFTIAPTNIFQGLYYRLIFFISHYAPWTFVVLAVIAGAILISISQRFFSFNIGVRFRKKQPNRR